MNQKNIVHITAVTQVMPDGQKCVQAVIEYDKSIDQSSVDIETFQIKNRNITHFRVENQKVILQLDPQDEGADTYRAGMPFRGIPSSLVKARVEVSQKKEIRAVNGECIRGSDLYDESDCTQDELVDLFIQEEYKGQKYNLFIPKNYDASKKYPIVQFIHDASACGTDTKLTLTQGIGALVWAREETQKKHPCFVFAPQFEGPPIVDDDWNVDSRLEDAKTALDHVIETYNIDRDCVYTTGQSMGCMSSIVLNVRYPHFFAASFLVAGQWDDRDISGLEKQKLWMICSQGDAKAFPIMNQMCVNMEKAGAKVVRQVVEAGLPDDSFAKLTAEMLSENPDIIFTPYRLETVADGWHSNGGEHHVNTWRTAYLIEPIKDWLFAQHRRNTE